MACHQLPSGEPEQALGGRVRVQHLAIAGRDYDRLARPVEELLDVDTGGSFRHCVAAELGA